MLSAAGDIKDVYDSLLHLPAVLPKSSSNKIKKPNKPTTGSIVNVVHEGRPVTKVVVIERTLLYTWKRSSEWICEAHDQGNVMKTLKFHFNS